MKDNTTHGNTSNPKFQRVEKIKESETPSNQNLDLSVEVIGFKKTTRPSLSAFARPPAGSKTPDFRKPIEDLIIQHDSDGENRDCGNKSKILVQSAKELENLQDKFLGANTKNTRIAIDPRKLLMSAKSDSKMEAVKLIQNRPSPMEPLKAWRGFTGNIYFDPIKIRRVNSAGSAIETVARSQSTPGSLKPKQRHQPKEYESPRFVHCDVLSKPAVKMDTSIVKQLHDPDVQEDLEWIRASCQVQTTPIKAASGSKTIIVFLNIYANSNSEHIGSLRLEKGLGDKAKEKKNIKSICKGSVAHQVALQQKEARQRNNYMTVSGGTYNSVKVINPLLKTSTQYSQSLNRLPANMTSITHVTHVNNDKLPSFEQLRTSLRFMSEHTATATPVRQSRPLIINEERIPAYVKLGRNAKV